MSPSDDVLGIQCSNGKVLLVEPGKAPEPGTVPDDAVVIEAGPVEPEEEYAGFGPTA